MLKVAWTPEYAHPLPEGHRFPMAKYDKLPELLLREGTLSPSNLFSPSPASPDVITLTHDPEYLQRLEHQELDRKEQRKTGFPLSPELVHREKIISQGTIDCCAYAMEHGAAMNVAGGTHHAYFAHGEGFCLLNDIVVSSNALLKAGKIRKVLVVDLDVHQGNGTAHLTEQEDRIFTFSMHGANNYPMHKETSNLDIPLPDGTDNAFYLTTLKRELPALLDREMPDLIHFQSGVDVLASDKLGRLGLSLEGCKERDRFVLSECKRHNIPVVCTMGGGYSEDLSIILEAHANTYRLVQEIFF